MQTSPLNLLVSLSTLNGQRNGLQFRNNPPKGQLTFPASAGASADCTLSPTSSVLFVLQVITASPRSSVRPWPLGGLASGCTVQRAQQEPSPSISKITSIPTARTSSPCFNRTDRCTQKHPLLCPMSPLKLLVSLYFYLQSLHPPSSTCSSHPILCSNLPHSKKSNAPPASLVFFKNQPALASFPCLHSLFSPLQ